MGTSATSQKPCVVQNPFYKKSHWSILKDRRELEGVYVLLTPPPRSLNFQFDRGSFDFIKIFSKFLVKFKFFENV